MSNKVPQIRFNGYSDDWEERKLGDYVIIRSGWSPSNFDINNNANNLFIKVDDLNYSTRVQKESQVKVNILSKYKKMKKSSTIFPKRGAAIMTNKVRMLGEDSYMDTNMMALEPKGIDPEYLYTFINKTGLYKIADTSTIPQINNKHIEPYLLLIPSLEEQHKIGSFFKQLDETIALHQRKLDLLKEQKKGYLQKMFPKNGAKVPELRFAGFADDWEERKLKDVVEKQIKGKAQFEKLAPGEVEYLDTSRLNGGQAILTNGLKDVTLDDILILWDGSKAGTVYHGFEGALGSTLKAYRTSANSKFVYQYLKRHQDNIYNNYRTPNIPHVQKDFLNVFTISVPVSDEQEKIASFFKQLDDTIALHQRKLDLLKEQKKGYLQKMFAK